jgi:peroxiredoxin (alkyl hydroperoxide reductase subunit C)
MNETALPQTHAAAEFRGYAMPRLNEPAPDFEANTTHGPRKLSDYRGKWLLLFSHPGDFTPVCTSEFVAYARNFERFKALECELLGLSVDGITAHLAWTRNIKEKFGIEIPFPVIDDLSMRIASAYGMIHPGASDTSTVRATFFIDPQSRLRAILYYPMTNGRSTEEFLRLITALQTSDKYGVVTPEGWKPGDKALVPPPKTASDADARLQSGLDCVDWYFCRKDVPATP